MDSSILHPPNIFGLSDNVIGSITHATWEPRNSPDNRVIHYQEHTSRLQAYEQCADGPSRVRKDTATAPPGLSSANQAHQLTGMVFTDPWQKSTSSWNKAVQSIAILQGSGIRLGQQQQSAILYDALKKIYRHRFLQASYKRKQNESMDKLECDLRHLRCEVEELQSQINARQLGNQPRLNHGAIARRYQQQFAAFVSDPARQKPSATAFLLCILAPEAVSDPIYGVEAILENWRLIAGHFDEVHLEINDLVTLTTGVLVGTTTTSVTISDRTLRLAFPHLNSNGMGGLGGGEWSSSAIKLRGKKFMMRGSMLFHLDNSNNQAVRIESQADMWSPILHVLGSLDDVDHVLDQALVTPDFRFTLNSLRDEANSA